MTVPDHIIEAVASAIRDTVANAVDLRSGKRRGRPWAELSPGLQESYRIEARAAIAAYLTAASQSAECRTASTAASPPPPAA